MHVDILSYNKNSNVGVDLTGMSAKTATLDAAIAQNALAKTSDALLYASELLK